MNVQLNTGLRRNVCSPVVNNKNKNSTTEINFKGNLNSKSFVDKILKNKVSQKLFRLADLNPFAFNIAGLLATCVLMRPLTILAIPGTNKEDKRYAAGKSVISSIIANGSRLIFVLPLGLLMKKMGQKAVKKPEFKFPKIETDNFNSFNYLVNNGFAFVLSLPMSALMVVAVAKVMNKVMPPKKSQNQEKIMRKKEANNAN